MASVAGAYPVGVVHAVRRGVGHSGGAHGLQLGHVHAPHEHPVLHARSTQVRHQVGQSTWQRFHTWMTYRPITDPSLWEFRFEESVQNYFSYDYIESNTHARMAHVYAHVHAHAHIHAMRTHIRTHTRTHTLTHARTHTCEESPIVKYASYCRTDCSLPFHTSVSGCALISRVSALMH